MISHGYFNAATPSVGATFDVGGTSTSAYHKYLNQIRLQGQDISIYHNVSNNDMTFHATSCQYNPSAGFQHSLCLQSKHESTYSFIFKDIVAINKEG